MALISKAETRGLGDDATRARSLCAGARGEPRLDAAIRRGPS
jgi:hypothetical protein